MTRRLWLSHTKDFKNGTSHSFAGHSELKKVELGIKTGQLSVSIM